MAIQVNPQTYYDAATSCAKVNSEFLSALSALWKSLQNSGEMAGSYDRVTKWGSDYDEHSLDLLSTSASLSNALANFSNILNTAGNNWAHSNWNANPDPTKGAAPTLPMHVPQGLVFQNDIQAPPSSCGGDAKGLDTSIPGLLSQIGYTVPNGDRDKLLSAAEAWKKFTESAAVKNAEAEIKKISSAFDSAGTNAPDLNDVKSHLTTLAGGAAAITAVSATLTSSVGEHQTSLVAFRSDLDTHVNDLMRELLTIAAVTVGVMVLTEILTIGIATLGPVEAEAAAGAAAGAAAITAGAARIRKLWDICRLFQTLQLGVGIALAADAAHPLGVQSALDDIASLTAVAVAGAFVAEMAKGGKQRVADSGIEQEMRDLMSRESLDKCGALAKLWDLADAAKRQRIKKTQKAHDCRQSSGGGGR
ncbi:polymorphic toxin type 34 domain-containing protein [Nocardia sp. NPDC058114]|uniref:polymorphic toxin type 34 domain-containing protein n=1 Tax=Nocardia sp. NPDC058114 TaxID=3346346 RepID=UPI0036DECE9F